VIYAEKFFIGSGRSPPPKNNLPENGHQRSYLR